jgi:hypothetical protein
LGRNSVSSRLADVKRATLTVVVRSVPLRAGTDGGIIERVRWTDVQTLAIALVATGCTVGGAAVDPSGEPVATEAVSPSTDPKRDERLLIGLRVMERTQPDTYSRDAFGSAWIDIDGNGCNQRDDVLRRDAVAGTTVVEQQGACDHDVLAGTWVDPYTGSVLTFDDLKDLSQAQAIQIDHVVPLAEAWVSGADSWSDDRRREYANDLDGLLATDGPTNASKGAYDPAAWRPKKDFQCAYADLWITVKARWDLTVDTSEVMALQDMLGYC